MPTYQYACTECGHAFDQFQSFSDDALTDCPECTGRLRKLFNAVGVVFKGSGFYRNDSRKSAGSTSGSDSSDASGSGSDSSKDSGKGADKKGSGDSGTTGSGSSTTTSPATTSS